MELLCALTIGLMSVMGVVQLVYHYQRASSQEAALANIQENARYALYALPHFVMSAGWLGCLSGRVDFPINNVGVSAVHVLVPGRGIQLYRGLHSSWQPRLPAVLKVHPKANTDVIWVRQLASPGGALLQPVDHRRTLVVGLAPKFHKKDDVMVWDCEHAVMCRLQSVRVSISRATQTLYCTRTLPNHFNQGASVSAIQSMVFFVKATSRKNRAGKTVGALYLKSGTRRSQELISNVEDFKVQTIVKNAAGSWRVISPDRMRASDVVQAVWVELLLASENPVLPSKKIYYFHGGEHMPRDHRVYQSLRFLIPIANHQ